MSTPEIPSKFQEYRAATGAFSPSTVYQGIFYVSSLIALFSSLAFLGHYIPHLSAFTNTMSFMKDPLMSGSICAGSAFLAITAAYFKQAHKNQAMESLEKQCNGENKKLKDEIVSLGLTTAQKKIIAEAQAVLEEHRTLDNALNIQADIEKIEKSTKATEGLIKTQREKLGGSQEDARKLFDSLKVQREKVKELASKVSEEKKALDTVKAMEEEIRKLEEEAQCAKNAIKSLREALGSQEDPDKLLGRLEREKKEAQSAAAKAYEEKATLAKAQRKQIAKERAQKAKADAEEAKLKMMTRPA